LKKDKQLKTNKMNNGLENLERVSTHYKWTVRTKQRVSELMKQDAIEFFKWNALKVDGYVKYIEQIKPLVTSNEIEEALNTFEGATLQERYELYLQSKSLVV
jgi:hypothetical protein